MLGEAKFKALHAAAVYEGIRVTKYVESCSHGALPSSSSMAPKLGIGTTERGHDLNGFLEMVDRLLHLAPRTTHVAKDTMAFADPELINFARE